MPNIFFTDSKANTIPIILIHGAGGSHLHWPPQLRHAKDLRVIAVDLPGHGKTGGAGCESLEEYAKAIIELMNELKIEKAIIGGHSMGGGIAQLLALDYAERVAGLVLVGTSAKLRVAQQILDGVKNNFAATVEMIVEWSFASSTPPQVKQLARQRMTETDPDVLWNDFNACNNFDVVARVNQIKTPTLIMVGSADKMTPEKFSRSLAEQIAGSQLKVFPDAGHMLTLERMEEVTGEIRSWMMGGWVVG
ncbi:MAG: alpha/beta hydrolase [Chloroflexi bacterium]|nr:alpha/beta hydrolase [Chloroflexota bacterium]